MAWLKVMLGAVVVSRLKVMLGAVVGSRPHPSNNWSSRTGLAGGPSSMFRVALLLPSWV